MSLDMGIAGRRKRGRRIRLRVQDEAAARAVPMQRGYRNGKPNQQRQAEFAHVVHHLLSKHKNKKADVTEHPEVFHHVGLLVNEPPGTAELLFD